MLVRECCIKDDSRSITVAVQAEAVNRLSVLSETTITENLIYEFWKLASGSSFPIEIYEAKSERTNGNDLEIFIQTDKGYLFTPAQAKILYSNDQYMTMPHQVRGAKIKFNY